tara:strand:+ start:11044 stop:11820 length:777 start_codon:yes stop_codon:yes gene_type:complete
MLFKQKLNRYKNLISDFSNWPSFIGFKSGKKPSFQFRMRNGFKIEVKRQMLPPFKESFFDKVYLKHFPENSLPHNPVIVDIGANVGFFSLAMFSQFPKARIFAFEPMPFNFQQLNSYKKGYPEFDWKIERKAIADHDNGIILHSATVDSFSTMAGVFATDWQGEKIEVPTLTLGAVVKKNNLEKIDLLKLDCEGSEYAILYSLNDSDFDRINLMSIESHPGTAESQNHRSLLIFLNQKGFTTKEQMNPDGTGYIWAWK